MIQLDILNVFESSHVWSFCYVFVTCLPICDYTKVVIGYAVAVFDSGRTFEY